MTVDETDRGREYDIVLAAQAAAIEMIAPGLEYNLANDATVRVII